MSLNFDVNRIADYDKNFPPNDGRWNDTTTNIVFSTLVIDMGEITKKNYKNFYSRLKFYDQISGGACGLSLEDVRKHIGLTTNVLTKTNRQFVYRVSWAVFTEVMYNTSGGRNETTNMA